MVIMASGIARGRVRTMAAATTTVESRKMASILQITGWQRDMQPWFTAYFFGIGHPCYNLLTRVKTRYPLTSITWVSVSRAQVDSSLRSSVFWRYRWPGASFSIGSRTHVWLTCWKQGRIVREASECSPRINVNQIITFSSMQMFLLLFCVYCDYWNSKQKGKQYTENLGAKLQNSNQNSTFSWVSLIGLWTTRSRSYAFRLA